MTSYNLNRDFNTAYGYPLIPKFMAEDRDMKVELRKFGLFDIESATNEELDLLTPDSFMSIPEMVENTKNFNPFEVKGNLMACRFPMTAMEIFGMVKYLEEKGLVNILDRGDGFGIDIKSVDWDNIPPNGFAIVMVHEMIHVPRVETEIMN